MSDRRHDLILLAERLSDLMDKVQDSRFTASELGLEGPERHLLHAEQSIEAAWQITEKAILNS